MEIFNFDDSIFTDEYDDILSFDYITKYIKHNENQLSIKWLNLVIGTYIKKYKKLESLELIKNHIKSSNTLLVDSHKLPNMTFCFELTIMGRCFYQ